MSSCLSSSQFQWTSSAGRKELGDSGEQQVNQQGAELCTAVKGEKTKQVAVNKGAAPQAFH